MNDYNGITASEWWGRHRFRYNIALVFTGFVAFVVNTRSMFAFAPESMESEIEVTIFTIIFQAFGYLVAMVIANICYCLGPLSERIIKPKDVEPFRRRVFRLGFWFSVSLPFLPAFMWFIDFLRR